MTADYILDVNEADFEYEVIAHSRQVPVVVDFWAEWCGPCRMLGPLLERLADEAAGGFRLAKLNVDDNPNLAMRYNVSGIPAVKGFRDGQVVAEFVGAQPEPQVRAFLRQLVPSPSDLILEKGHSLLGEQDWEAASIAFRQVLDSQPDLPAARLGLARTLLAQGQGEEAVTLLKGIPASKEYAAAEKLLPLAEALIWLDEHEEEEGEPLAAAYRRSLSLVRRGNLPAAMDGILDILKKDKRYRKDTARKVMLALLETLGEGSPLARQYRAELASVLF